MQLLSREPQSIGKLLDDGFRLSLCSYRPALLLSCISAAGSLVVAVVRFIAVRPEAHLPLTVAAVLLSLVLTVTGIGGIIVHYAAVADGRPQSVGASLRRAARRGPMLLIGMMLFGMAVSIGLLLFIIPGIVFIVSLGLFMYVMLIEGEGPFAALGRSHRLVWGTWWRTMTAMSVVGVIYLIIILVPELIAGAVMGVLMHGDAELIQLIGNFMGTVGAALSAPFLYGCSLCIYHDLRLRREGPDLARRIDRLLAAA